MHDPFLVRGFQRFADGRRNIQHFVETKRPAADALGQRLAVDKFQHQEALAIGFFQIVNGGNVGMIERRENL